MDWQFYLVSIVIIAAFVLLWGSVYGFDGDRDSTSNWSRTTDRDIESWRPDGDSASSDSSDPPSSNCD